MEVSLKSPASERWDSTTDVEAQLVEKDKVKGSPLRESKSEKVAFYIAVSAYFGCAVILWILAVFLTCFYAVFIRDSEDVIAIASIPLVCLTVVFIPLLYCSRNVCKSTECDKCPGCYGFCVLILGLLMLLSAVFVVVSAVNSSSSVDWAVGGLAAGIDTLFGLDLLSAVFYLCVNNRRPR